MLPLRRRDTRRRVDARHPLAHLPKLLQPPQRSPTSQSRHTPADKARSAGDGRSRRHDPKIQETKEILDRRSPDLRSLILDPHRRSKPRNGVPP